MCSLSTAYVRDLGDQYAVLTLVWLATDTSRIRAESATAPPVWKKGVVDFYEILGVRFTAKLFSCSKLEYCKYTKHYTNVLVRTPFDVWCCRLMMMSLKMISKQPTDSLQNIAILM